MAKIIINNQEKEIKDGQSIRDACEQLGVLFSCCSGYCGTCMIEVEDGEDNLTDLTAEERGMDRDEKNRLACQCKIKQGTVKIKTSY